MATSVFSPAALDQIVQETIPQAVDPTHTNAVVFGIDQTGAKVVAQFRLNPITQQWELNADAVAQHDWTGDNEVGAQVVLKW